MPPISHTSVYRPDSKLLESDGYRRTMLRMGPVHARDNGQGVSSIEPERTARYRDLLYAQTGIGCHIPTGIGLGAYDITGRKRSRGASTSHGSAWWPPGRIQVYDRATL